MSTQFQNYSNETRDYRLSQLEADYEPVRDLFLYWPKDSEELELALEALAEEGQGGMLTLFTKSLDSADSARVVLQGHKVLGRLNELLCFRIREGYLVVGLRWPAKDPGDDEADGDSSGAGAAEKTAGPPDTPGSRAQALQPASTVLVAAPPAPTAIAASSSVVPEREPAPDPDVSRSTPARKVITLRALERATVQDLNLALAAEALAEECETLHIRDAGQWLVKRRAAVWCNGVLRPTVAGMLLFGNRPHLFLPGMRIEATIRGETHLWTGTIRQLCDRLEAIPSLLWNTRPDLPEQLVRNSILHRDWSEEAASRPIRLTLEEGRLELRTPGRLHKRWEVGRSTPIYPALMRLARSARLIAGDGEGLVMLTQALKALRAQPFTPS